MGISLCIIARNEEDYLKAALSSVKPIVDEIVFVDTGSRDSTVEIAKQFTDKIFEYPWSDNFSKARNFSLEKAAQDWILVLDADEVISGEDCSKIKELVKDDSYLGYSLVQMNYTNDASVFSYTPILKQDWYTKSFNGFIACNIIRLFRNTPEIKFEGAVHESVDKSIKEFGEVLKTGVKIHHYQFAKGSEVQRNKQLKYLRIYEKNLASYPNKARAYRDIGIIYYNFVGDYVKAVEAFKKSLEINSNNLKTYVGMGLSFLKMNHYDDAKNVFGVGLTVFPGNHHLKFLYDQAELISKKAKESSYSDSAYASAK